MQCTFCGRIGKYCVGRFTHDELTLLETIKITANTLITNNNKNQQHVKIIIDLTWILHKSILFADFL